MSAVNSSDITVRQWKPEDVKYLMEFAEENEWDLSTYDHNAYTRIDPSYLLVAVDKSKQPVGFCGVSKHAPDIVYLGNFIVRKDLRGKGIGRILWKDSMKKAGDVNIVLDGGTEMEEWYKTHGFPHQAFKVLFHHVKVTPDMKEKTACTFKTVSLTEDMWPAMMAYDRTVYPSFDRTRILKAWFTGDDVRVVVALDNGNVVGYGSIHKKPGKLNEYGIRNVLANNEDVINEMLHNMLSGLPEGTLAHFMILDDKPLPSYVKHSIKVPETARRMFSKEPIKMNTERLWFATAHIV